MARYKLIVVKYAPVGKGRKSKSRFANTKYRTTQRVIEEQRINIATFSNRAWTKQNTEDLLYTLDAMGAKVNAFDKEFQKLGWNDDA